MKIRLAVLSLAVFAAFAFAQISYPTATFLKALGAPPNATQFTYKGAEVTVEELGGYLYKVHYKGPKDDYETAAEVIAAAIGNPGIKQPFIDWIKKNQAKLDSMPKPVTVGLDRAYFLVIEDGEGLVFRVIPYEVDPKAFGEEGHVMGKGGVVIREYSDFQCPYCKRFQQEILPELEKRYIETGRARFEFNHFPLTSIHQEALNAAIASECAADQGAFWAYHDEVFQKGAGNYEQKARDLKLDLPRFNACIASDEARQRALADRQEAIDLGLNGTPSVFVGPFLLPNPFDLNAYERYLAMAEALQKQER